MRKQIKKYAEQLFNHLYHKGHKRIALNILQKIEKEKGKTNPLFLKKADEYAREIFGWKGYSPWLYVYSAIAEEFKEGWIPDNYYGKIVVPKLKGEYGKIADKRALTRQILQSDTFPDLFYFVNGLWFDTNYNIVTKDKVEKILKIEGGGIFKSDTSVQGKGVKMISQSQFNMVDIQNMGNGVLQKFIRQHDFYNKIIDQSVATLRLTTAIDNEGIINLVAAYLRVGSNNDKIVKSASHIRIPVNLNNGELDRMGYTTDWKTIDKHPYTGFVFQGKTVPLYNQCVKIIKDLHKKLPYVRIIGWDLIVNNNNEVKLMEWNGSHNDIKFSEATQGPIFKGMGLEELWKK